MAPAQSGPRSGPRRVAEVSVIDWHVHPKREERWYAVWSQIAERSLAFGAHSYSLTRSEDDPQHFRESAVWESREDFQRYWTSDEVAAAREQVMPLYNKPLIPSWHTLLTSDWSRA